MKLRNLMFLLPLTAMAFLSSCGDDEAATPKPTANISIAGDKLTGTEVESGTNITISTTATAGSENLRNVVFTAKINGGATNILLDTAVTGKSSTLAITLKTLGSAGDDVEYIVTVNDANGTSATASSKLSVMPKINGLDGAANQTVYNYNSQSQDIAYDLVAGFSLAKSTAPKDQDIKDGTANGTEQWSKKWTSGNGTTFVKVTENDWNNASSTTYLFNLWKANKDKLATSIDLVQGDVILVKSTQSVDFNIYLIKITGLTDNPAIGNHNDFATFDYKGLNYPK